MRLSNGQSNPEIWIKNDDSSIQRRHGTESDELSGNRHLNEQSNQSGLKNRIITNLSKSIKHKSKELQGALRDKLGLDKTLPTKTHLDLDSDLSPRKVSPLTKDPESAKSPKYRDLKFPILEGNHIRSALLTLLEDGHIKYLKNGNSQKTREAINRISTQGKYAVGYELRAGTLTGNSVFLKEMLKNLEYFQYNSKTNKDHLIFFFIVKGDYDGYKSFKNLYSYQTLINTKLQMAIRAGDKTSVEELSESSKYLRVLQKYEDDLLFLVYKDTNQIGKDEYKAKSFFRSLEEEIIFPNKERSPRDAKPKKVKENLNWIQKFSNSPENKGDMFLGYIIIAIMLLSILVYQIY